MITSSMKSHGCAGPPSNDERFRPCSNTAFNAGHNLSPCVKTNIMFHTSFKCTKAFLDVKVKGHVSLFMGNPSQSYEASPVI